MAEVILITGGSRSGKSDYAQKLAESHQGKKLFLATCPVIDQELKERVKAHQQNRDKTIWDTVEEEIELAQEISKTSNYEVILIDCLTLWVNNLLYRNKDLKEEELMKKTDEIFKALDNFKGLVIFVTNEIGLGIVPADPFSRKYRDFLGRLNQVTAQKADKVILLTCGIPLELKKSIL